ncbi:MAG TPA: hemagglutinin protein, partial [Flavobacteriales bacterium]
LMNDSLRQQGLVPHFEPYTELGCTMLGGGYEKVPPAVLAVTGPDAIVDWVLVELRSVQDPTLVRSSRAALVQRDGDVVEVDGTNLVRFPLPPGNYHLCVRHRNHLGVMTAAPVGIGPAPGLLDLGSPATSTWGIDARKVMAGKALLWCGEVSGDRTLRYTGPDNDRDRILLRVGGIVPTATVTGYLTEDLNMDGRVKYTGTRNDRDRILQNVGIVPTEERYEQVP